MSEGDLVRLPLGHYVLEGDFGLSALVFQHGGFSTPTNVRDISACAFAIPEGGVVIDAGACIGDHTAMYAQAVGPMGHVHACEPHPVSYQALVKNTAILRNVTTYQVALGDHPSVETMWLSPSNIGGSYIGPESPDISTSAQVQVTTMDALLGWLDRVDFIHLDAEGFEPQILRGGAALIAKYHPAMLIEVTDDWLHRHGGSEVALLRQLEGMGYHALYQIVPHPNGQYDVMAVHDTSTVWPKVMQEKAHAEVS